MLMNFFIRPVSKQKKLPSLSIINEGSRPLKIGLIILALFGSCSISSFRFSPEIINASL